MKLGDKKLLKMQKLKKFWRKLSNFSQKLDFLKITEVRILPSKMKLVSWNLILLYLYIVSKNLWNRFLKFWFFLEKWPNGHFANFVQYFGHISEKQKNMDQKHQILTKFLPYISIEKLSDGQPTKLNNFLIRRNSFIL